MNSFARTEQTVLAMVDSIEKYCNLYQTWPKQYTEPKNNQEKLSLKLSIWLRNSHYNHEKYPFKYANVHNKKGVSVLTILDDLFKIYGKNTIRSTKYIWEIYNRINIFVTKTGNWPKHVYNPQTPEDLESNRLIKWLNQSGFTSYITDEKTFKYYDLTNTEGKSLGNLLTELYNKYYIPMKGTKAFILARVRDLKKYCRTYNEWPKAIKNPKSVKEKESYYLYNWLNKSHYNHDKYPFKYADIEDENGINIKTILDTYYGIFGVKLNFITDPNLLDLNIWQAKDSKDKSTEIYFYIVKMSEYSVQNFELYNYYLNSLKVKIKEYNLNLNIQDIVSVLMLGINEQKEVFFDRYLQSRINNDEILSSLYNKLYSYALMINDSLKEEQANKRHG